MVAGLPASCAGNDVLLSEVELMVCKLVTTESHPGKGWIGITTLDPAGHTQFHGVFTRNDLIAEVNRLIAHHGDTVVRTEIDLRKVSRGSKSIFVPYRDAYDARHAESIIRQHVVAEP